MITCQEQVQGGTRAFGARTSRKPLPRTTDAGTGEGPAHRETRLTRGTENRGEASLSPLELPRTPLDFQVALMSGWRGRGEGPGRAWEEVARTCEKNRRGHSAFPRMPHGTQLQKSRSRPSEQTGRTPRFLWPAASEVRPWTAKRFVAPVTNALQTQSGNLRGLSGAGVCMCVCVGGHCYF